MDEEEANKPEEVEEQEVAEEAAGEPTGEPEAVQEQAGEEKKEYAPRGYSKPVQVGDEIEVTVEGKGRTGDGVAKVNGYVIFIKGETEVGQKYRIKVVRIGRNFATAELA